MVTKIAPKEPLSRIPLEKRDSLIGKKALVTYNGLTFEVLVKEYKVAYGTTRWLVEPVTGSGEAWLRNIEPLK